MRYSIIAAMSVSLIGGCSRPAADAVRPAVQPKISETVNLGAGTAEEQTRPPHGEKLWKVAWKSAVVQAGSGGLEAGQMSGVTGTLYRNNQAAASFQCATASADRAKKQLRMSGAVRIRSAGSGMGLKCDQVLYDAGSATIHASGKVQIIGPLGGAGTFTELLATPDLKLISTPGHFTRL